MAGTGRDETRPKQEGTTPDADKNRHRLAEALRANLERRKKQKRTRRDREASTEDG